MRSLWTTVYTLGLPAVVVLGALVTGAVALFLDRLRARRLVAGVLLLASVLAVAAMTLSPLPGAAFATWQLVPVVDVWAAFAGDSATRMNDRLQAVGNVLMFVPLGLCVAHLLPRPAWRPTLLLALTVSVLIELGQAGLRTGRSADVNDVLLNVLGAAVGYGASRAHWGRARSSRDAGALLER